MDLYLTLRNILPISILVILISYIKKFCYLELLIFGQLFLFNSSNEITNFNNSEVIFTWSFLKLVVSLLELSKKSCQK